MARDFCVFYNYWVFLPDYYGAGWGQADFNVFNKGKTMPLFNGEV